MARLTAKGRATDTSGVSSPNQMESDAINASVGGECALRRIESWKLLSAGIRTRRKRQAMRGVAFYL